MDLLGIHRDVHYLVVLFVNLTSTQMLNPLDYDRVLILNALKNVRFASQLLLRFLENNIFEPFSPNIMLGL